MAVNLTEIIKPSDFKLSEPFCGSTFNDHDTESVARNIIMICLKRDDTWKPFSFQDYRSLVDHVASSSEEGALNWLAVQEFLSYRDGRYEVEHSFIAALANFLEEKRKDA